MSTKRTPISRPAKARIPPEALDMFARMKELEGKRCRCKPPKWKPNPPGAFTTDGGSWVPQTCSRCEEWHKLNVALCRPLRLKPWDFPAVARPHWERGYGVDREIFAGQQQRYRELEAALEARGKRDLDRPHTPWPRRIYPASKSRHAGWWRALRSAGVPIVCSWIDAEFNHTGSEPTRRRRKRSTRPGSKPGSTLRGRH
jgi:hypothetical protein